MLFKRLEDGRASVCFAKRSGPKEVEGSLVDLRPTETPESQKYLGSKLGPSKI